MAAHNRLSLQFQGIRCPLASTGTVYTWYTLIQAKHTQSKNKYIFRKKTTGQMAQWIKLLAARLGDLSLLFSSHLVEGENQLLKVVL